MAWDSVDLRKFKSQLFQSSLEALQDIQRKYINIPHARFFLEAALLLFPSLMLCTYTTHRPQNLIAQAQSGTGKTAAFVLCMLQRSDPNLQAPQVSSVFTLDR
jgi:superfamily II DNA/RNA helicase